MRYSAGLTFPAGGRWRLVRLIPAAAASVVGGAVNAWLFLVRVTG
jgi:hypothetical protein